MILARMRELADNRTPWHRALWQSGSIVMIAEVSEAVEATWSGAIASDEAMRDVIQATTRQVKRDPGLGTDEVRAQLVGLLDQLKTVGKTKPTAENYRTLSRVSAYVERCRTNYMLRWIEYNDNVKVEPEDIEVTARMLVAHLIDEGFHRSHVHGWLSNVDKSWTLSQVVAKAREMLLEAPKEFRFLISFVKAPKEVSEAFGADWRPGDEFVAAYEATTRGRSETPRAGAGAIEWRCISRDPHAAMSELAAWQQRILSRAELGFGTAGKVEFGPEVVDLGSNRVRTPRQDLRPIRIPSIQRSRMYGMSSPYAPQLDGAIGLLASHSGAAVASPSIASVWAAAEGLLGRPGGKGVDVADRLADIVTCSFPRAELSELSRAWLRQGEDQLGESLRTAPSSREQARLMAVQLEEKGDPGFSDPADRAAAARYLQLVAQPAVVMERVRSYYSSIFRRLYYQRNFVMHAAKFDSVTLSASARTAPILVAAALDRIVNAQHGDRSVGPLDLAARAENELKLLGLPGCRPLHQLLD